ncbi:voltage-gated chloride channel family protein [Mucilaginibacter myungsuensis]|uniref:Voltage-gated chloride channel family protein n=1 Tax=Mucilaginibacter myungsuensis TaxID=649104 RepID=A0A929KZV2_9SPHI|nr:voltage-gated chloride channel family protein [Mucilaginibacter myungsuensis]MBE9663508.1 voltage-gated chloride channel family protein [Mucilaginibacter myungsuensis]MDN3600246.1 voltage-gated chloride channel family protein [Mucilaginibacter myungsuensis]
MLKNIFNKSAIRPALVAVPVSVAIGSMVALFLVLLNWAIHFRFGHIWLLYLLPLAGIGIHFLYKLYGSSAGRGNDLIIDEIHEPGAGVPKRMAPLILITTVITHLFGGSAGREGTAVQIGGSVANWLADVFKLDGEGRKLLLTAGIAAGFGAVFGTPITGAMFAIEVLTVGRLKHDALIPCLVGGLVGHLTVWAWSVPHTHYHIDVTPADYRFYGYQLHLNFMLMLKAAVAAICFGVVSYGFARATHLVKDSFARLVKISWLIPAFGGVVIVLLTFIIGKPDYLSLGVAPEYPGAITIPSAFYPGGADASSWIWKLVYTSITLGTGFKGGEVTPLFYIGATLGNALAGVMSAPVSLFAALGFIGVFCGATKTPIACTIMGWELFGPQYLIYFAVVCLVAYLSSGKVGIYSAQRRR